MLCQIVLASEVANYNIQKGLLHTGGFASVEILENAPEHFSARLKYKIFKKILVPIPEDQLEGESIIEFPQEFKDEGGYMELETKGVVVLTDVILKFVQRLKWPGHSDAYQFLILPKNGKTKILAVYHPSIPAAGWIKLIITFINNIPIFNGYEIVIDYKNSSFFKFHPFKK